MEEPNEEGYIELTETIEEIEPSLYVKVYRPRDFAEIRYILDDLREGIYICFVNISSLKNKSREALKHTLEKMKKTVDAIGGDIAVTTDDWVILTPRGIKIWRESQPSQSQ